jgi:hypothetical protein
MGNWVSAAPKSRRSGTIRRVASSGAHDALRYGTAQPQPAPSKPHRRLDRDVLQLRYSLQDGDDAPPRAPGLVSSSPGRAAPTSCRGGSLQRRPCGTYYLRGGRGGAAQPGCTNVRMPAVRRAGSRILREREDHVLLKERATCAVECFHSTERGMASPHRAVLNLIDRLCPSWHEDVPAPRWRAGGRRGI